MHSTCLNTIYTLSSIVMRILFLGFAPPLRKRLHIDAGFGHKFFGFELYHLEYLLCVHMMDGHVPLRKLNHLDEKF